MATTRFHSLLRERVEKHLSNLALQLQTGSARDFEQYQHQVGYAQGMRDVLAMCDEIEGEFDASRHSGQGY